MRKVCMRTAVPQCHWQTKTTVLSDPKCKYYTIVEYFSVFLLSSSSLLLLLLFCMHVWLLLKLLICFFNFAFSFIRNEILIFIFNGIRIGQQFDIKQKLFGVMINQITIARANKQQKESNLLKNVSIST